MRQAGKQEGRMVLIALTLISSGGSIFYPDGMAGILSVERAECLRWSWTSIWTRLAP